MAEPGTTPAPVASLPMYDWPEVIWAHDVLWREVVERLSDAGIDAPAKLDRAAPAEDVWRSPGLVLSQTCGYPFATRLRGHVQLVAAPIYAVEGCNRAEYSSVIVARSRAPETRLADFRGRRFAFNSRDSLSGYVAFIDHARANGLPEDAISQIETGSHRASVVAVAEGRADVAAIDAVCWALAGRHEPKAVAGLRVIDRTISRSALPFITAGGRPADEIAALRLALLMALAAPATAEARKALHLSGAQIIGEDDYLAALRLSGEGRRRERAIG